MEILTVKIQGDGYLVNDKHSVPGKPGNSHYQLVQAWIALGNTPDPEFTASEALFNAQADKISELKQEGLSRIQAVIPAITGWDALELVREQWLSLAPAARQPTSNFDSIIETYQAGRNAAQTINGFSDVADVRAYDVATTPSWP